MVVVVVWYFVCKSTIVEINYAITQLQPLDSLSPPEVFVLLSVSAAFLSLNSICSCIKWKLLCMCIANFTKLVSGVGW